MFTTNEWAISKNPEVTLKIRSSVWKYLTTEMDVDEDCLALSWCEAGWIAGVLPRNFPGVENALKTRLDGYTLFFPQPELLERLHGRVLQYESGVLSVV